MITFKGSPSPAGYVPFTIYRNPCRSANTTYIHGEYTHTVNIEPPEVFGSSYSTEARFTADPKIPRSNLSENDGEANTGMQSDVQATRMYHANGRLRTPIAVQTVLEVSKDLVCKVVYDEERLSISL
jgi:hypothetical protein